MSKEIIIGQKNLRFIYYRYKDSPYYFLTIIIITIIICLYLFFNVILPQINNWFSIKNEEVATQKKIQILINNINIMNELDKTELENQLQIAFSALPSEKDFGAIINVISNSALQGGVSLEDYSFQVGDISSTAAQLDDTSLKGLSIVRLTISVIGKIDSVKSFLQGIVQKLPLSEVTKVEYDDNAAVIDLQFYQKGFPQVVLKNEEPIQTISDSNKNLIKEISTWESIPGIQNMSSPNSSPEAIPLF